MSKINPAPKNPSGSNPLLGPAQALECISAELTKACKVAGRGGGVTITAVSKKHKVETILPALEAGHRTFGENRVQEAMEKWPSLKDKYAGIKLHLIGPLQSNKAKEAVALFDVIETLDRPKLARVIGDEIQKQGRNPVLLVQINTGAEPQKAGILPEDVDRFMGQCQSEYGLTIAGMMCIPPIHEAPAPHFALLHKLANRYGLQTISMGMSADYKIAAKLGASHVRIGSAIFGARG